MFKCEKCEATSEQAGDCQACNVPMIETTDEEVTAGEEQQTTEESKSEEPQA